MTHSWESELRRDVASFFIDRGYHVRSDVYLGDTGRYVDLVVVAPSNLSRLVYGVPSFALVIETESNFESAFKGVSQAAVYKRGLGDQYDHIAPLVLVPPDHVEEPERTYITEETGVPIKEFDP